MSPRKFWRTTPALFNMLNKVHSNRTNPKGSSERVARTVEEVPFLI